MIVTGTLQNTFEVATAQIRFDFRKPQKSTLHIVGFLPVPDGNPLGVTANVSITGSLYSQNFTLNTFGDGGDSVSLFRIKTIQGGRGISRSKFMLSLNSSDGSDPVGNPSLFQKLTGLGFGTGKVDPRGSQVPLELVITLGSLETQKLTLSMIYKVAPQRTGKAVYRKPK